MTLSEEQITAGASWLAENVKRVKWDGLYEGSVKDKGFDPWLYQNARQDDYRDAVRGILSAMNLQL